MCVYLRTKFSVFSIILTSSRQEGGGNFTSPPQNRPRKCPPRLGLKKSVPGENPIIFHNGCNYDYHFIIKELAEKFDLFV